MSIRERVSRFRQPEYTGDNRCMPCTVVNLMLAAITAGGVAVVSPPAALVVLSASIAAIYLRGYLLPGTRTLTKRYLPDAVLRLFDKHERPEPPAIDDETDLESFFLDIDAVEECRSGTDLCLTDEFRREWTDHIDRLGESDASDAGIAALFNGLGIDADRIRVETYDDAYEAYIDDTRVGQWESQAAYLADLAADEVIRDRQSAWDRMGFDARTEVLGSLRLWLERCPTCHGPVTLGEDTVESCCRSIDVIAATCESCGARLFEAQFSPEAMAAD
jgi:hypothetical protein